MGVYAIRNWPKEFVDDFSVLLNKCHYDEGSLSQSCLNTLLCHSQQLIQPLPPVHESAFESHVKPSIYSTVRQEKVLPLTLYLRKVVLLK